jgi:hypothetical protein
MQALLSFDQGPPISAPLRYFMTAPLFAICAGLLLLWSGPDLFASRWTPAALALTHLITVGFMMQVMLGAMQQLLPVLAGANIRRPLLVATVVHVAITVGGALLVLAFLTSEPKLFGYAVALLGGGVMGFVGAAMVALHGVPATSPIVRGIRLGLLGLCVTVGIGMLNAVSIGWSLAVPLQQLTNVHLGWGFVAWGGAMLGAVSLTVVPMFQQTPNYPNWFGQGFAVSAIASVALWTLAELTGYSRSAAVLAIGVVLVAASFALMTLKVQRGSKRPKLDAVQLLWRVAMVSALVACALWLLAQASDTVADWRSWPLLFGAVLLFGGFMSVILGMLYKIVPFLVWLHLQNRGHGRLMAPNMKKVLAEKHIQGQMRAHFVAYGMLLLAVLWPAWFVYPAGLALVFANAWLLRNLLSAVAVYRSHLAKIIALDSPQA